MRNYCHWAVIGRGGVGVGGGGGVHQCLWSFVTCTLLECLLLHVLGVLVTCSFGLGHWCLGMGICVWARALVFGHGHLCFGHDYLHLGVDTCVWAQAFAFGMGTCTLGMGICVWDTGIVFCFQCCLRCLPCLGGRGSGESFISSRHSQPVRFNSSNCLCTDLSALITIASQNAPPRCRHGWCTALVRLSICIFCLFTFDCVVVCVYFARVWWIHLVTDCAMWYHAVPRGESYDVYFEPQENCTYLCNTPRHLVEA